MATIATIIALAGTAAAAAAPAFQDQPDVKTPQAAKYNPVNLSKEQTAAIQGNFASLPSIDMLMQGANGITLNNDIRRAKRLVPGYRDLIKQQAMNAGGLLRGELPYDDVLDIAADRSAATNALGIPGTAGPATLRDLGLSRLDAMKTGGSMLQQMISQAEQVSPISRQISPREMFVSPTDRIRMAIDQAGTGQQSSQNVNNLAAIRGSDYTTDPNYLAIIGGALQAGAGGITALNTGGAGTAGRTPSYGNPAGTTPGYSQWATGPQAGTYYVPPQYQLAA